MVCPGELRRWRRKHQGRDCGKENSNCHPDTGEQNHFTDATSASLRRSKDARPRKGGTWKAREYQTTRAKGEYNRRREPKLSGTIDKNGGKVLALGLRRDKSKRGTEQSKPRENGSRRQNPEELLYETELGREKAGENDIGLTKAR